MAHITPSKAPVLPLVGPEYSPEYFDHLLNYLKLYFDKIDLNNRNLLGVRGGQYLTFPTGSFSSTANQTPSTINTPKRIEFNRIEFESGMNYDAGTGIYVDQSGVYNYTSSVQLVNADTSNHTAYLWLRVNGTDVGWSTRRYDVGLSGGELAEMVAVVELETDDYVELWWATDSTDVSLEALAADAGGYDRPGKPSVVSTLTFVSGH